MNVLERRTHHFQHDLPTSDFHRPLRSQHTGHNHPHNHFPQRQFALELNQRSTMAAAVEQNTALEGTGDEEDVAAGGHTTHCLVCYSDLTTRGKTPCGHDDICGVCHLRLRFLHSEKKCPICKTENNHVIVDKDASKPFDEYPMWGDEIGAGFIQREDVGMFFGTNYYEKEILPLFGHSCQKCDYVAEADPNVSKKRTPLKLLQEHLRSQHRLNLCSLCVDNKRDFVSKLPRMTPSQLQKHLKQGDGQGSGFTGHPVCEFCKPKRFYDLAELHQHLHKDHYKCHICEKQGNDNQFFKNYKSLERHFDQQHFLCHDVQCLGARFVVFENDLDLRAHELSVHGGTSTGSTKINLEFRTRRPGYDGSGMAEQQALPSESDFNYGLDGQAFVPQALPTANEVANGRNGRDVQIHPLHLQRTEEFRAQAAVIREQQSMHNAEESFPTLEAAAGPSAAPLVGWSSGTTLHRLHRPKNQAGKVTAEDFPTLGSAPSANSTARQKAMKGNIGATRRQFAAMSTSAARPTNASSGNWGNAAAAVGPSPAQANNFLVRSSAPAPINRQADLAPSNFPSLGAPSNTRPTPNNFPSLSAASVARPAYATARTTSRKTQSRAPAAPALNSAAEFPSIGAANQSNGVSVRSRVMGNTQGNAPSQQAVTNMLQLPTTNTVSAKVTVEEMKGSLGSKKYKELKRLTREFADGNLSPEAYVDLTAALFQKGYADSDFWSFVPSLLQSCPNTRGAEQAQIYMTTLKQQQFVEKPAARKLGAVAAPTATSWGNNGNGRHNVLKAPPVAVAPAPKGSRANLLTQPVAAARPFQPHVVASKKKSAWGAGGTTTVARAKAPPGSVAAAAASQGPQGGSATKFMAKQAKQETQLKANQNKTKGKKKKTQKNELRALAFGGK